MPSILCYLPPSVELLGLMTAVFILGLTTPSLQTRRG